MSEQDTLDLLLMRHGAPAYPSEVYPDPFSMPLSAQGRLEAKRGAAAVERFGPDLVFSSDFLRASETAQFAAVNLGVKIQLTSDLRERVFYSLAGKSFTEIIREHGDIGKAITEGNSDLLELPGEEVYAEAGQRVVNFIRKLALAAPGNRVLVVCHGGPHAWLIEEALNVDLRGSRSVTLRTGFFSRFKVQGGHFKLVAMNLPPIGVSA